MMFPISVQNGMTFFFECRGKVAITRCVASLCNKNNNQKHNDTLHTHTYAHAENKDTGDSTYAHGFGGRSVGVGNRNYIQSSELKGVGGCTGFTSPHSPQFIVLLPCFFLAFACTFPHLLLFLAVRH